MEDKEKLKLLALKLIQIMPDKGDQYSMQRLFGKACLMPNEIFDALRELETDGKLLVREIKYTVKYYSMPPGLDDHLNSSEVISLTEDYALKIDKTGFLTHLLRLARGIDDKL